MSQRAYVLGDLHLGSGPGEPLEDFADDDAFAAFCGRIAGPDTTLILNGDIIDFAQIAPFDVPEASHLLWTEDASRAKLAAALAGHPAFFAALADLIRKGSRLVWLYGNHDLDVFWSSVQAALRTAIGGDDSQLRFGLTERYHGVHIEHGFQFTPENCPLDPESFVHTGPDGKVYLERVWGTDFMLQFFNQVEREHPFADNVKPMLSLVWHGLQQGWIGGRELLRMLVFLKRRGVPWGGLASTILAPPPELDPGSVAASFDDPQWQAVVAGRVADASFVAEMQVAAAELGRDELLRALDPSATEIAPPVLGTTAPSPTLGLFREPREERAARDRLAIDGVTGVVFGHTHHPVDGALDGRHFNYGTWLPRLDLRSPVITATIDAHGLSRDMLGDRSLYRIDRSVVRLDPDPPALTRMRMVTAEDP